MVGRINGLWHVFMQSFLKYFLVHWGIQHSFWRGTTFCRHGIYCCSVAQSCPTLCDPVYCHTPGFPVLHDLLELVQTYVHWVSNAIQTSCPVSFLSFPDFIFFPASRSFVMSSLFTSGSQSIGASASGSVLPMNIQDWFPLEWTGWISLLSKGLSRVLQHHRP